MLEINILVDDFSQIVKVLPHTIFMSALIFIFSTGIGTLIALIFQYNVPIIKQLFVIFSLFLKGTPMVIYIFLTYFIFPVVVNFFSNVFNLGIDAQKINPMTTIIVALTLSLAPFQAEIIRGSFLSVDYGQVQAADAFGYTFFQKLWKVIIPQAVLVAIPDLANSLMVILKALSLAFTISVVDIFAKAQMVAALNFHYLEAFVIAAVIYWILALIITLLTRLYETKNRAKY